MPTRNDPSAESDTKNEAPLKRGSLVVVGTGIRTTGQLTVETLAELRIADTLLYVVGDPVAANVLAELNPNAESMADYYKEGEQRINAYEAMIQRIMASVRRGERTVAAFYGHPGVFAYPSHESIRRLRAESYDARMLPGISAEDCLFADLGVDPAVGGCQSYEATDFLLNGRVIDTSAQLILWQVGTVGDWTFQRAAYDLRGFPVLVQRLLELYPASHPVTTYEASIFPMVSPVIQTVPVASLHAGMVNSATTLYIPAARVPQPLARMRAMFAAFGGQPGY